MTSVGDQQEVENQHREKAATSAPASPPTDQHEVETQHREEFSSPAPATPPTPDVEPVISVPAPILFQSEVSQPIS